MKIKVACGIIAITLLVSVACNALAVSNKSGRKRVRSATVSKTEVMGQTDPKKALLYIIRPSSLGFGVDTWSFCDDKVIGLNRGKSYFFTYLEPGPHIIWSKSENISPYGMTFEAGKAYYFKEGISMGVLSARVKLSPITEDEGKAIIDKHEFKMLTLTDAGLKRGERIATKKYSKVEKKWIKRKDREAARSSSKSGKRKRMK